MKKDETYPGYTPYGYIQNPHYQCRERFSDITGALLRSDDDMAGFGCFFPDIKHCDRMITLGLGVIWKGEQFFLRSEWERAGYYSGKHSAQIFSFCLPLEETKIEILYFLKDKNKLGVDVSIPESLKNESELKLFWVLHLKHSDPYGLTIPNTFDKGCFSGEFVHSQGKNATLFQVMVEGLMDDDTPYVSNNLKKPFGEKNTHQPFSTNELFLSKPINLSGKKITGEINFESFQECLIDPLLGSEAIDSETVYSEKSGEDLVFYSKMPRLTGDWESSIKNGWVYDFETTRMCLYPPMGVFKDVWPSWMITYPRAVLAEGAMDMNRMGYADPDLAKRAILSLFRDTGAENVPCVFYTGVPNMIAQDGSICGTSPAWCLPFYQIFQLYLRDLDKTWLKELYPYLKAYHQWWEKHRSDEDGYVVYRCTWEAGEDDSPRLDPKRTGDNVISEFIRPVELQASMAVNAHIMKFFCQELLTPADEIFYWECRKAFYMEKLHTLWDASSKRFRDWDKEKNDWLEVKGEQNYWNADFTRLSPLSLMSVLFDLSEDNQKKAMQKEILLYGCEPFNVWPSWNYVLTEAAAALHMNDFLSEFSWEIIERVYSENDSRVVIPGKSLPGGAREYWPLKNQSFKGNDAYAWGAQTTLLLIHHIMGLRSSQNTKELIWQICPSLPKKLMVKGKEYGMENNYYRGVRFDLHYKVISDQMLKAVIHTQQPYKGLILVNGKQLFESQLSREHVFLLKNLSEYEMKLIQD